MVIINLEIAFARDFKIKQAVTRKQIEHVIEERQPGAHLRLSLAVEVEEDTHVGFFCLAVDLSGSRLGFYLWIHNHPIDKLNQPAMESVGKDSLSFSVHPLCSLCLCGEFTERITHHRGTENTEVAERMMSFISKFREAPQAINRSLRAFQHSHGN